MENAVRGEDAVLVCVSGFFDRVLQVFRLRVGSLVVSFFAEQLTLEEGLTMTQV